MPPAWDSEGPPPTITPRRPSPSAWRVRCGSAPLRRRHLRHVVQIEEANYPRPWSSTLFLSEIAQRRSRRYTVATIGPLVVGYSGLMVVEEDGHITTLTVDPGWHRRSIGTVLLLDQARAAPSLGVRHLTLEVRASNASAQALYRRFGFAPVGVRRNYYPESGEDAIVMWARDIDTADYAERAWPGSTPASGPCHERREHGRRDRRRLTRARARHRDLVRRHRRGRGRRGSRGAVVGGVEPGRPARHVRRGRSRARRAGASRASDPRHRRGAGAGPGVGGQGTCTPWPPPSAPASSARCSWGSARPRRWRWPGTSPSRA